MAVRATAWAEARRLVVGESATYAEAAEATGLPVSTIEKRAAAEGWQAQRQTAMSYDAQMRAIKSEYATQALAMVGDPDKMGKASQLLIALTALEKAYPEHKYAPKLVDPKAQGEALVQMLEQLVAYLSEHDPVALAALEPHVTPFAKSVAA